jgi:hypothetical protein
MSSSLYDQWPGQEIDRIPVSQSDPKIIILTDWKILIECTDLFKNLLPKKSGGETDKTEGENLVEDPTGIFSMSFLGIHKDPVPDPSLFCITHHRARNSIHQTHLNSDLVPLPKIVRIQKSDEVTAGLLKPRISCGTHSPILFIDILDVRLKRVDNFPSLIRRSIINHDDLKKPFCVEPKEIILVQNRLDRFF